MSDRPGADDLLDLARQTVLVELLPQLPPSAHYAARMVANAVAIARREHRAPAIDPDLAGELAELAGVDGLTPDGHWQLQLSTRIRAGDFDANPDQRARVAAALGRWTRLRVAVANPRILQSPAA